MNGVLYLFIFLAFGSANLFEKIRVRFWKVNDSFFAFVVIVSHLG